ncbi:MAG: NAD(+) synthase [Eubacteriales bacterium]
MRHGFIKAAAATPKVCVANTKENSKNIIKVIKKAKDKDVKLLVLPELCLTAYTCGDLFLQSSLLSGAVDGLKEVVKASEGLDMLIIVGAPLIYKTKLYNCATVIYNGDILGVVPKSYLPNYNEFYEKRHFNSAPKENGNIYIDGKAYPFGAALLFRCSNMPEFTLAVEICEDLWATTPPSSMHALVGATVIANLSASDETVGKADYRVSLVKGQSARFLCGYLFADAGEGESTTDMVFAGHNIIAENGIILNQNELFDGKMAISEIDVSRMAEERRRNTSFETADENKYTVVNFEMPLTETKLTREVKKYPFVLEDIKERESRAKLIIRIQGEGLKKRIAHAKSKTAVVGISGGLDSCLALLVAVRAMKELSRPTTDVVAVTMPCFGTTSRTKSNAQKLSECLNVTFRDIDITKSVKSHLNDIGHDIDNLNVVYENAQARERTQVLMDIANQMGGLVVGTGDLSELALGWATYNGDHMSMYGVNASVPKTLVRHIIKYVADEEADEQLSDILNDILDTPVSPELLPGKDGEISQKTEDIVGPYELHDFFLYNILRFGFSPSKVYKLAVYAFNGDYTEKEILKWLKNFYKRFFAQQFKRSCLPDGPKVGTITLSPRADFRMPSDASSEIWLDELSKL